MAVWVWVKTASHMTGVISSLMAMNDVYAGGSLPKRSPMAARLLRPPDVYCKTMKSSMEYRAITLLAPSTRTEKNPACWKSTESTITGLRPIESLSPPTSGVTKKDTSCIAGLSVPNDSAMATVSFWKWFSHSCAPV